MTDPHPFESTWSPVALRAYASDSFALLTGEPTWEEGLASGLIQTSQRLGFPLGLAILLTVASVFDPLLGLTGFRYAFLGSTVLGAAGLGLAILLGRERALAVVDEGVSTVYEPVAEK